MESKRQWKKNKSCYILSIGTNYFRYGVFVSESAFLPLYCRVKKLVYITLHMLESLAISFLTNGFQAEYESCIEFKEFLRSLPIFISCTAIYLSHIAD